MLAVGATHYWDTHTIADYSSQGPTPDGRIKPDIVGAACGKTATDEINDYHQLLDGQDCWFAGTSASSPHVAGIAALVKQRFPDFTPQQVTQYLKDHAEERGAAGADNVWGSGFAKLLASDAPTPTPSVGDIEKEALVALYNATDGANWTDSTNWLNDEVPLNSWHGVATDNGAHVTVLNLPGNNLTGSIPSELGNLANLRHLSFGGNQLSGTIPVEIGRLSNLTDLYLGYNQLSGAVPGELANLVNLERLHLDNNRLTGAIQPEFGSLSKLETLYLQRNQLTGALPQTFTQLDSLEVFAFDNGDTGLCAPTDDAFQNWLQGISNQQLAAGVTPLGPDCTGSTAVPTPAMTIRFGDLKWSSMMLQNRIAQYIAEKGYGYSTSVEFGSTHPLIQALRTGDVDVLMEIWLPNQEQFWEEALAEGTVFSPGSSLGTDWQSAFVIPKYLQDQYPGLDSVADLKEERYRSLFATDETDGKARLVSCVIGWLCEVINAKQIEGYGLSDHVHIVIPDDGAALNADLTAAYENREPWLGYQWGTNDQTLLLDLIRLEEPVYSDECWSTTMACAYEDTTILIAVNAALPDAAADFVNMLTNWDFNVEEAYKPVVRWQVDNPEANTVDAAMWWLRGNNDVWSNWVTEDAAASIKAALDAGEIPEGWPEAPSITPEPTPTDPCVETLTDSTTINGSWNRDCVSTTRGNGNNTYARFYTFSLDEPADVRVSLTSEVDTYLYIREGADADGAILHENDDHDSNEFSLDASTDSGIATSLDADTYTIEATTHDAGQSGALTLDVQIGSEPVVDCTDYSESPDLAEKVASGELPSLCDRMPSDPVTIQTLAGTGEYGGILRRFYLGPADGCNFFRLSHASLVRYSQDGFSLIPSVARDWEMSEDGREWTFHLREGMKWSDGDDFNVDDFVWQYENVIMNEELALVAPLFLRIGNEIGSVEKVDDTTVKFVFPQPNFLFAETVAQADEACYGTSRNVPWAPSHYMQQFHIGHNPDVERDAQDAGFESWTQYYDYKTQYNLNMDKPTIAPWKFTNPLGDRVVLLERNPYFWGVDPVGNQLPYLDGIQMTLVESTEEGTQSAIRGEIDMQGRHIRLDQYVPLRESRADSGYSMLTWPAFGGTDVAFFFNMSLPGATGDAIRTKKFRQALSLAIDRESIKEIMLLGFGEVRQNVPPPGHSHYPGDDIAKLRTEFDVEEANRLLDSVFADRDVDGWRLSNGERIVLSVTVTDTFGTWPDTAQVVGRAWEAVGVKTDVNQASRAEHFGRWYKNEWAVMVWNDNTTASTFIRIHTRAPAGVGSFHAPGCGLWLQTGGREDDPDAEGYPCVQESLDLLDMHRRGPGLPEAERNALAKEIYRTVVENQYSIGIVGLSPMVQGLVVRNNMLQNVPDVAANDWTFRTPNSAFPEQWYFGPAIEPVVALPAALSAGPSHACALDLNGVISCQGVDDSAQLSGLPASGVFTAISVGEKHSCAIDLGGRVHCWGSDEHGQVSGRPTSGEFIAIGAGARHTCAIDARGSVHCWGSDEQGQSSPPTEGRFVAVGAGDSYTCGLRSDRTLDCWGAFDSESP